MSLWWCVIHPCRFCDLQWLRPAGLYERCKLAVDLKRLKTPTLGYNLLQVRTPAEQLQQFERGRIAGLQEARWTYRRIVTHVGHNVSVVCCCFQQWSMEYSHTCRPGSWWLCSSEAHQEQHIVQAAVVTQNSSREEIQAHVATAVSPRTIGNLLLAAGLRLHVPLARLQQKCQARLLWCCESQLERGMVLCCLQWWE